MTENVDIVNYDKSDEYRVKVQTWSSDAELLTEVSNKTGDIEIETGGYRDLQGRAEVWVKIRSDDGMSTHVIISHDVYKYLTEIFDSMT